MKAFLELYDWKRSEREGFHWTRIGLVSTNILRYATSDPLVFLRILSWCLL